MMNSLRSFYSNVLYAKDTVTSSGQRISIGVSKSSPNLLAVPSDSGSQSRGRKVSGSLSGISDNFVKSVEKMESAVLVPTKLLDIPVKGDQIIPELVAAGHSNLYEIFKSIRKFKEKLLSMTVTQADLGSLTAFEVEDIISNFRCSQQHHHQDLQNKSKSSTDHNHNSSSSSYCDSGDSGIWSSHDSTVTDADVTFDSMAQVTASESVGGCSGHASGSEDSDEASDGPTSYVVRKTLNSAKGFCAFLIELSHVTDYVIRKYMEEMNCGDN